MNLHGAVVSHRARRAALALLTLLLVGAGPACSARRLATELAPASVGEDSRYARQLLVTFKPVDAHPLRAAGSNSGPYVGPSAYTVSERTRREVARLSKRYGLREVEDWPIRSLGIHCVVFEVALGRSIRETIDRLARDPRIDSVQPMNTFDVMGKRSTAYDDPYAQMQHGLDAMRVWEAHPWARGRGVAVAVVDTGVHRRHPDLAGRVVVVKDFVGHGSTAELHGTAVAGVIASRANNGIGTVGVAPEARILALRACWEARGSTSSGHCNSFTLAKALDWVVNRRPEVLNLSLAGPHDPLLERLLLAVLDEKVMIVAAYERDSGEISFPGSVEGVLLTRSPGETTSADVSAPGHDILAAVPGDGFDFVSGNSFAAAHVSGVVALLLERAPWLGMDEVRRVLKTTSRNSIIDACAALAEVAPGATCSRPATPQQP
jgi:hypothetical protein